MIKKKTKGKAKTKKTGKKSAGKSKKVLNPAEVRQEIAQMVKSEAASMASAVIGEGKKGQLAPVKYLLELAKVFPEATDGSQATAEEECLAKTLMRRLDLPEEPVVRDEEDPPKVATADPASKPVEEAAEKSAAEGNCEERAEAVVV